MDIRQNQIGSLVCGEAPRKADRERVRTEDSAQALHEFRRLSAAQALFNGTAARLGSFLKDGSPYYYYAKTGTTGDNEAKTKSKLFTIIISAKDITNRDFSFRNDKFYIIYFTSQNGPAKQNEEFQAEVIKYIQQTPSFNKYMKSK